MEEDTELSQPACKTAFQTEVMSLSFIYWMFSGPAGYSNENVWII